MMESIPYYIIILTLSSILLLNKLVRKSKAKKKQPPSPPSLPIIGHLHLCKRPLHQTLTRFAKQYGSVFSLRFGSRPVLVVSSASTAQECLAKNDLVFANRVQFPSAKHVTFNFTTIGSANYGPHYKNLRRIATTELLSSVRLNLYSDIRAGEVRELIRSIFAATDPNGSFTKIELKERMFEFQLNNLMKMITGKRSKKMEEATKEFQVAIDEVFKLAAATNLGDFFRIFRWIDYQGLQRKLKRNGSYRNGVLQKMLNEYRLKMENANNLQEEKTMIGVLLSSQKTDPQYYTDEIIKGLISDIVLAGVDTTAITTEWTMTLLLNNPDKLKKVQNEIDEKIGNERLVQESDLPNLPYLQAVIMETLRIRPATPLLIPHESSEDCVVEGYDIPKKTMLIVNAYYIQKDEENWENAEEFIPERFLNVKKDANKLLSFGYGRRRCPGEYLAYLVLGSVIGSMVQCFDWQRVGEELIDMTEGTGITLSRTVALQALCKPRDYLKSVLSTL